MPSDWSPTPQECPSGIVNEENFKQIYSQFFPQGGKGSQQLRGEGGPCRGQKAPQPTDCLPPLQTPAPTPLSSSMPLTPTMMARSVLR